MAWTSPLTAVTGDTLSAAQYNASVRDNLAETFPARATAAGQFFVSAGSGVLAARTPTAAVVAASEQTSSSAWTDLATAGPRVTVTTGTTALVWISARMRVVDAASRGVHASFAVSGATTAAPSDARRISVHGVVASNPSRVGACARVPLTPGSNTFTMRYRVDSGAGNGRFEDRELVVLPL